MKIVVLLKMVPDVVEELEVAADGKSLDSEFLRMILGERDSHALEQALLLKEKHGGAVTVVALDAAEVDDALFTTLAKGADRAVKVLHGDGMLSTRAGAYCLGQVLATVPGLLPADLILTGVQAIDDLDGLTAPLVAQRMGLPYIGVVSQVEVDPAAGKATVVKEYAGGVRGEYEVTLPAVLGIQAAEKPPRYVPVAKVRAAMTSCQIEKVAAGAEPQAAVQPPAVLQLAKPAVAGHAEMLAGTPEEIASKLSEIMAAQGLL